MEQGRSSFGNEKGGEECRTQGMEQEELIKKIISNWKKLCKLMKDRWIPTLHTNVDRNYFLFLILYKASSYPE